MKPGRLSLPSFYPFFNKENYIFTGGFFPRIYSNLKPDTIGWSSMT
jgi:hypothetical protein